VQFKSFLDEVLYELNGMKVLRITTSQTALRDGYSQYGCEWSGQLGRGRVVV
jgi:hypothetical protein